MRDKRKAKEKTDVRLKECRARIVPLRARAKQHEVMTAGDEVWGGLKTGAEQAWDEVSPAFHGGALKFRAARTNGHGANGQARSLAEAIILQSIEDLWSPACRRESLLFFKGEGFALWSELAGLNYIKQLAMLRILSNSGQKTGVYNMRKAL